MTAHIYSMMHARSLTVRWANSVAAPLATNSWMRIHVSREYRRTDDASVANMAA